MDIYTHDVGVASQFDINDLCTKSADMIQVSVDEIVETPPPVPMAPRPRHIRNFSRKLYTAEPISTSPRCPSGDFINLTSGLSFMDSFTAPQPLEFDSNINTPKADSPTIPEYGLPDYGSTAWVRRSTSLKLSSVPSSPVAKPVRPSFGRSVSLMDSRSKANPAVKAALQPAAKMETAERPAIMRSPTTISGPPTQQPTHSRISSTVSEKLGWLRSRAFSSSSTATTATIQPLASPAAIQETEENADLLAADPLINLDISAALFPTGIVDFTDYSSFNSLLANATSLIETLQSAYKQRSTQLNETQSKHASQTEDLDEAEERVRHLRMQLSNMSSRMTETELSLRSQLADECQKRKALEIKEKERAARRRTNPYRRGSTAVGAITVGVANAPPSPSASDSSTASEGSDSGFESDDAGSRYSSHYSPASSPIVSSLSNSPTPYSKQLSNQQRQQIIAKTREAQTATPSLTSSCTSPEPSEASWDRRSTMDPLAENFALRHRVAELESAVEACLRLI